VVNLRDAYSGWAILMVMIDDATGRVYARFYENESWASAADVFVRYVGQQGLPRSLYVDQHGIYRADWEPTKAEILAGKEPETQFGRAMRELDVELILAHSPQAKGRVERMNGTLQDRLVKALRQAGINDLTTANQFLEETFLPEFNIRFCRKASQGGNLHRRLGAGIDLGRILSVQETRVLQNDWTVSWRNQIMQLPRESADSLQPKQRVTLCEQLDGRVRIFAGDREVSWTGVRGNAGPAKPKKARCGPTGSSQGQKPSATHPWRGKGRQEGEEVV